MLQYCSIKASNWNRRCTRNHADGPSGTIGPGLPRRPMSVLAPPARGLPYGRGLCAAHVTAEARGGETACSQMPAAMRLVPKPARSATNRASNVPAAVKTSSVGGMTSPFHLCNANLANPRALRRFSELAWRPEQPTPSKQDSTQISTALCSKRHKGSSSLRKRGPMRHRSPLSRG